MDIRVPIGLMFSSFGVLLTVYGLISDSEIYKRSLGINVNLWWGLLQLVFGLVMLYFGRRGERELRARIARGEVPVPPDAGRGGHGH